MSNTTPETFTLQAYSLVDFSLALQAKVLEGYRLNATKNDTCPVQLGTLLYCVLERSEETAKVEVAEPEANSEASEAPTSRRGRKPSSNVAA